MTKHPLSRYLCALALRVISAGFPAAVFAQALTGGALAGTITTTNTSSQSLVSSTPVTDSEGVPMQPDVGFIAVGTFRTMSDTRLRHLTAEQRVARLLTVAEEVIVAARVVGRV